MVALVAEQTGYPPELLDLDLDLEADLGIDTVKQAELFAQVRETYGIDRDDSLKLRDYPTLNHVIGFVRDRTPQAAAATVAPETADSTPVAAPGAPARAAGEDLAARVVALVAEQTGYPPELLDLDLDLEADLGIDTVKQAELFAQVRETYGIARDDSLKLRDYPTLNHVIGFVRDRTPQAASTPPPASVSEPTPQSGEDPGQSDIWGSSSRGLTRVLPRSSRRIWRRGWWRWSPSRPATRPSCSTSTSTWRPTSASTPSSRPNCSPRSARPTGSPATTRSSCATTRRSTTSSASSATAPPQHGPELPLWPPIRRNAPSPSPAETARRRPRLPAPCAGAGRAAARSTGSRRPASDWRPARESSSCPTPAGWLRR